MANVLIVDDALFMRMMLRNILEEGGHTVVGEGENGIEGIKLYKTLHPDIVTLDITMPVMNGIEALKEIREFDENAKVIMCSAMGQQTLILDSILNGAKDFIIKPFIPQRVLESIEKSCN